MREDEAFNLNGDKVHRVTLHALDIVTNLRAMEKHDGGVVFSSLDTLEGVLHYEYMSICCGQRCIQVASDQSLLNYLSRV